MELEKLTTWLPAKRVETKQGPRLLRTGAAGESFWTAWRAEKDALRAAGISCSRKPSGEWQVCWWSALAEAEVQAEAATVAASRAADADFDAPAPDGLSYLPFQRAGIAFAQARPNVLIADEMGLGKTIQALGIINCDESLKRVLIVCPASLKLNWQREAEKWLVHDLSIGIADAKGLPNTEVVIVNYDLLKKLQPALTAVTWDALIADEVHYAKNAKAQRSKALYAINARRKIFLTGTPILNRPIELFPIVSALDPVTWPSFFGFAKRYANAHQTRFGWDFSGAANLPELQQKLRRTIMVRRKKADVLTELPAKRRQIIALSQNGAAKAVKAEAAAFGRHEAQLVALRAQAELAKAGSEQGYRLAVDALRNAAKAAFEEIAKLRHETALAKVPYVVEHVKAATDEGEAKIVLFAHHKDVIARFKDEFGAACVTVTGDDAMADRQAAVDRFQTDPTCQVFIGSLKAAGVGLTLTASAHVVFAELDWTPGNMTQAEDRCHRIGQTNSVLVQHLVLDGSVDAKLAKTLVSKQSILDAALDTQETRELAQEAGVTAAEAEAATRHLTVGSVTKLATAVTPEQLQNWHEGLRILAGVCDGAIEEDGKGFNGIDSFIGKSLAAQDTLSPKQAVLAGKILKKYRKQLARYDFELS